MDAPRRRAIQIVGDFSRSRSIERKIRRLRRANIRAIFIPPALSFKRSRRAYFVSILRACVYIIIRFIFIIPSCEEST